MYPSQTSLIPVQIALARFLEQGGDIFSNYPYWYLGTTPYRYLTGPILPAVLATLHKIFPALSLFDLFFLLLASCFLLGGLGVYLLVATLMNADEKKENADKRRWASPERSRRIALLSALFYLLGPLIPLLFPFSDGLSLISFSFLPFILLLYVRFLKTPKNPKFPPVNLGGLTLGGAIAFLLLLNISILPTLVIGMAAIFLAVTGWEQAEEKLKQTLLLTVYCLLFTTLWYTPGFWLARLGVPSLAGRHLIQVVLDLGKLLPAALAITAAFISVKFFKKRNLLRDFCFYWLFIFGFLTLMRFISDLDFWLDWSSYAVELQMGLGVLGGLVVDRWVSHTNRMRMKMARIYANMLILLAVYCSLFAIIFNNSVINTLQPDITQTVEYRIGLKLTEIIGTGRTPRQGNTSPADSSTSLRRHLRGVRRFHLGGEGISEVFLGGDEETADHGARVLLSGTTAFWLNAFFDIPQVRGGVDQASVDPNWRRAVWEIREGTELEKSLEWLRDLDISYLVVHTEESEEYYHDFTYPEKFEGAAGFEKIYDVGGDRIYRIRN